MGCPLFVFLEVISIFKFIRIYLWRHFAAHSRALLIGILFFFLGKLGLWRALIIALFDAKIPEIALLLGHTLFLFLLKAGGHCRR